MTTPKALGLSTMIALVAAMFAAVLMPGEAAANQNGHYYYSNHGSTPCPTWSIQDVLDDPNGDWDRDHVTNSDEIYVAGGLNPCRYDSTEFCGVQPASCYRYLSTDVTYVTTYVYRPPVVHVCSYGNWTWGQVNANPYGDWDGDGVTNHTEASNGANPCVAPCPTAYHIDVALNPWGDWDGDGRTNAAEVNAGTNPCRYNGYVYVQPHTYTQPTQTQRLPHVGGPAPAPKVTYVPAPTVNPCPAGYPYYHEGNGQCYANPVNTPAGW